MDVHNQCILDLVNSNDDVYFVDQATLLEKSSKNLLLINFFNEF
jgi:hypothetical protein